MIKLYRQIRYKLLQKEKTSRYFKYAAGEIILVVIGILIALSINNWNSNINNLNKEKQYLESFIVDLDKNRNELNRVIEKSDRTKEMLDSIFQLKRGEIPPPSVAVFEEWVKEGFNYTVYKTQEGTIKDIIGSGNLGVIKNDSIRLAMVSWEGNLKSIREWESLAKNSRKEFAQCLNSLVDIYKEAMFEPILTQSNMNDLLLNRIFLNQLMSRIISTDNLYNNYVSELVRLEALISNVKKDLE